MAAVLSSCQGVCTLAYDPCALSRADGHSGRLCQATCGYWPPGGECRAGGAEALPRTSRGGPPHMSRRWRCTMDSPTGLWQAGDGAVQSRPRLEQGSWPTRASIRRAARSSGTVRVTPFNGRR